jgi:protein-S-isoprenylcysteine O-methyltransferase Ste14
MLDPSLAAWLAAAIIVGYGSAFAWRSRQVGRERQVYAFAQGDPAQRVSEAAFRLSFAGTLAYVVARAIWPEFDEIAGRIAWLDRAIPDALGLAAMLIGAGIALTAQIQMGRSWRIGVPKDETPELMTLGLFRFSRNPTFLGMLILLAGVFLLAPSAATLSFTAIAGFAVAIQVRLEEARLAAAHGSAYEAYRRKVRRWL